MMTRLTKLCKFSGALICQILAMNQSIPEMKPIVAICAKSDQIFGSIIAKSTARANMVYLKAFRSSAILTSPAVSLQYIGTKFAIGIRVES
jgi:small basic protein